MKLRTIILTDPVKAANKINGEKHSAENILEKYNNIDSYERDYYIE